MADKPKESIPPPVAEWSQNKRFIRTFESDSAAIKSGGKGGMFNPKVVQMPVLKAPEDALSRAVADANSDTITLDSVPAFDPKRVGALPDKDPSTQPAERLVGGSAVSEIPALTADMMPIGAQPPLVSRPLIPESLVPIHTYTSDFTQAVKEKGATPAGILAAEQDARRTPQSAPTSPGMSKTNLYLIIGAIVLILLGIGGAFAAYFSTSGPKTVAVTTAITPSRIFVDAQSSVSGTGQALEEAIEQSVQTPLAANAVRLLSLTNATATDTDVFSALQLPAPDILLRNIAPVGSIAGVVNVSGVQSPFFILAVESYSDTFSGMLSWEPDMGENLSELFPPYPQPAPVVTPVIIATTTATSTTVKKTSTTTPSIATTSPPQELIPPAAPVFRDEVVDNHNARALEDAEGRTILIYGYWDQNTLVIARDENAFTELLSRLATSRNQQQ